MLRAAAHLALVFGAFLALAELARNWGSWQWWPFWLVDFIAAGLLVAGASRTLRERPGGGALLACILVNVWRTFPFSAIVLLAGFTSVPNEVLDAAKVDGCTFFQSFRNVVVPMIFPILMVGFLFDTVFTLSDLSVVYILTQGGPGNATQILPVLAYQIGIQAGNLGRGAAIALFLVPLLAPVMFIFLRNLKRREY